MGYASENDVRDGYMKHVGYDGLGFPIVACPCGREEPIILGDDKYAEGKDHQTDSRDFFTERGLSSLSPREF